MSDLATTPASKGPDLTLVKSPDKTMQVVYQYGCRAPVENADVVREQMRANARYRNLLVEITRGKRDALRAAVAAVPIVAAAEATARVAWSSFQRAQDVLDASRAAARRRAVDPAVLAAYVAERDAYRATAKALGAARKAAWPLVIDERDRITELANELGRSV